MQRLKESSWEKKAAGANTNKLSQVYDSFSQGRVLVQAGLLFEPGRPQKLPYVKSIEKESVGEKSKKV